MTSTLKGGRREGSGRRQQWFKLTANAQDMLATLHSWENREREQAGKEVLTVEAYLEALIAHYFGDEVEERVEQMKAEGRYSGDVFEEGEGMHGERE